MAGICETWTLIIPVFSAEWEVSYLNWTDNWISKWNRIEFPEKDLHIYWLLTWEKLALKIFLHCIVVKKAVYQIAQRMIVHVEKTKMHLYFIPQHHMQINANWIKDYRLNGKTQKLLKELQKISEIKSTLFFK